MWGQGTVWYENVIKLGHRRKGTTSFWTLNTSVVFQSIFIFKNVLKLLCKSLNMMNLFSLEHHFVKISKDWAKFYLFLSFFSLFGFPSNSCFYIFTIHIRYCISFASAVLFCRKTGPVTCCKSFSLNRLFLFAQQKCQQNEERKALV